MVTSGDAREGIGEYLQGRESYGAAEVLDFLLAGNG
jgi:hypothetical protein